MSTTQIEWTAQPTVSAITGAVERPHWYAIQTRCRFEKKVATQLRNKGVEIFLPLVKQLHRWSDRRQVVEMPLFPGYGFVQLAASPVSRLEVLQTVGVTGLVMFNGVAVPVPEQQLEDVRRLLANEISCRTYPFLKVGQKVRIRGGCLDGLEGVLISEKRDHSLVVSIEAIQRSLIVRIDGYDVEAI